MYIIGVIYFYMPTLYYDPASAKYAIKKNLSVPGEVHHSVKKVCSAMGIPISIGVETVLKFVFASEESFRAFLDSHGNKPETPAE